MAMQKTCETCGATFAKRPRDSAKQWEDRAFCSLPCASQMKKAIPIHLYFWNNVDRRGDDDCWPWIGSCDQYGYGRVNFMTSTYKAHRVSYEMRKGPIPTGMVVRHNCDNPNCVNPKHLSVGTQKDNMQDASKRGRLNPKSLKNLRPGAKGILGAGPMSIGERNGGKC